MNIYEVVDKLAEKYHKGQLRKDGKEYITHPRAVVEIAISMYDSKVNYGTGLADELSIIKAVAVGHDILEDCAVTSEELREEMLKLCNNEKEVDNVIFFLDVLNKDNYKSYLSYIRWVKTTNLSTLVKLADLEHNLSDLKPGSLRDKYELAQYILNENIPNTGSKTE